MPDTVGQIAAKVRSKNAGPFWLTVDIFCDDAAAYDRIAQTLPTERVAAAFSVAEETLKRFDIPALRVVKFSLPRPVIQGAPDDRDMHGAGWGPMVAELPLGN